jgi:hypothetical protein
MPMFQSLSEMTNKEQRGTSSLPLAERNLRRVTVVEQTFGYTQGSRSWSQRIPVTIHYAELR